MGHFSIVRQNTFDGAFELEWEGEGADPASDDKGYQLALAAVMERLAADAEQDSSASNTLAAARKGTRSVAAKNLLEDAEAFVAGRLPANTAAFKAPQLLGRYRSAIESLYGELFVVEVVEDEDRSASDLQILVRADLPPPHDKPTSAQQALYGELNAARTTVRAIYQPIIDRFRHKRPLGSNEFWRWITLTTNRSNYPKYSRAASRLDHYVRELAGVASVGLRDGFVDLASLALKGLKEDLVAMEAPRIKNAYVIRLGFAALVAVAIWFAVWWTVSNAFHNHPIASLAVASIGAAIGTWLSFSIRRVRLTFEQLSGVEDDMLNPAMRLIFVWGLTLVVVLIFFTGAMNIAIGDLKTSAFAIDGSAGPTLPLRSESIYLLVGLFCGIAERTLASAVSTRATDFAATIGGGKSS